MTHEDFLSRFVSHMLAKVGTTTFDDGTSVEAYARDIAGTYWQNEDQREEGPEACAEADILEWDYQ